MLSTCLKLNIAKRTDISYYYRWGPVSSGHCRALQLISSTVLQTHWLPSDSILFQAPCNIWVIVQNSPSAWNSLLALSSFYSIRFWINVISKRSFLNTFSRVEWPLLFSDPYLQFLPFLMALVIIFTVLLYA